MGISFDGYDCFRVVVKLYSGEKNRVFDCNSSVIRSADWNCTEFST